jgi:hypothetical protein
MSANNYFLIEAGQKKRADLVYDSEPGAETLSLTRKVLTTDTNAIIYLATVGGNNANAGTSPAAPKLTYAGAVAALGGTRTTIQIENDGAVLGVNITAPTQVKPGIRARIDAPGTASGLNTWSLRTPTVGSDILRGLAYSPTLGRLVRLGFGPGSGAYSTTDGDIWTAAASWVYSTTNNAMRWSAQKNEFIAFASPSVITSPDGATWTAGAAIPTNAGQNLINADYSSVHGRYFVVGTQGGVYSGADINNIVALPGYTALLSVLGDFLGSGIVCMPSGRVLICGANVGAGIGRLYYSDDGQDFTNAVDISAVAAGGPTYFKQVGEFVVMLTATHYGFSRDGVAWTFYALPFAFTQIDYAPAYGAWVACANPDRIFWSVDGIAWTEATADGFVSFQINTIAATLTRVVAIDRRNPDSFNTIRKSNPPALTITANVAGFTIGEPVLTGAVRAVNCSQFYTARTAGEHSRCRGDALQVVGNVIDINGCLFRSAVFNSSPATQNAIAVNANTISGQLRFVNTAATGREQIRSNIVEGGISAAFTVTVASGNTRGANTNASFQSACTFGDPKFIDLTDYKLQYESQGFSANSPMVQRSGEFLNTLGQRRDLGAWSAYEANIRFIYARAFYFLKPAEKNAVQHIKHNRADLHVSIDGTPDVATDPAGRWEELVLNYRSLPNTDFSDAVRNHIAFVDYLESLENPACRITFDPAFTPAASVTVNGAQPAGTVVLNLLPSALESGNRLDIAGVEYMVLYMAGNSAVLSKPLAVGIADAVSIPVSSQIGYGVFQYVAPPDRRLTRWYEGATDFFNGLVMRFVRKWV